MAKQPKDFVKEAQREALGDEAFPENMGTTVDAGDGVDQEVEPEAYSEEKERAAEEKAVEQQAASPNAEPVPEGVAGEPDIEREERAEAMRATPMAYLTRIERAQMAKMGMLAGFPQQSANYPQVPGVMNPMVGQDPFAGPMPGDDWGPDQNVQAVEQAGAFFMVQYYGGRFRTYMFTSLDAIRGFAQNAPGTKRLYRFDRMDAELPEIDGRGRERKR